MQKLMLIFFLVSATICYSQPAIRNLKDELKQKLLFNDSVLKKMQLLNDSKDEVSAEMKHWKI